MSLKNMGYASALLGVVGLVLQGCLYPPVQGRLGTLRCYQAFCLFYAVAYFLTPVLNFIPQSIAALEALTWAGIGVIAFLITIGRTFTLPAIPVLLNNCATHPSRISTVHGMGVMVSGVSRTVGPVFGGFLYGAGLKLGMANMAWVGIGTLAMLGWLASCRLQRH